MAAFPPNNFHVKVDLSSRLVPRGKTGRHRHAPWRHAIDLARDREACERRGGARVVPYYYCTKSKLFQIQTTASASA